MRAFLARQRHWLVVERLPAYAPDLNPVELLWGKLKAGSSPTSASTRSAKWNSQRTKSSPGLYYARLIS
jgi:transposase